MRGNELAKSLGSLERKLIPFLKKTSTVHELVKASGMQEIEVLRALQWLSNKNVIEKEGLDNPRTTQKVTLTAKGARYQKERTLPERRVLAVLELKKEATRTYIREASHLTDEEIGAAIGILKTLKKISIGRVKNDLLFTLHDTRESTEELVFEHICVGRFPEGPITPEQAHALENLQRRGLIETSTVKERTVRLTRIGEQLLKTKISTDIIDQVTPDILARGTWKNKDFRTFDLTSPVPTLTRGKRHFVDQAMHYIKRIWLDLGFKEMQGSIVQTAFWDLDALFVPQDHPAREMQDTFFLGTKKEIAQGKIPKELAATIRKVHEHGGETGSRGWGGTWNEHVAKELLLRTHTTPLSAHTLATLKKKDLPAKFFAIGKVYRNEALDWKHLFEFYQVEGIVVDPNANFQHLLGYLKEFYKKMGFSQIRIRPSHFPYTEPSAEVEVYHPIRKEWIELGGAGIFRPEVVKPLLGFDCPVLAWGQGMERIIVDYYKIKDLRDLYKNDLKQLREAKEWMR